MKKLVLILSLFITAGITASAQEAADKKPESGFLVIETKINCDHCMQCGSCAGRINLAYQKHSGVKKVTIDPKQNTITIKYNPKKVSPEKLRDILTSAGFDADGTKADLEKVSALDGCCQPKE